MKFPFLKIATGLFSLSVFGSMNIAVADTTFRPSKLEARFYEIGFRNSSTSDLAPIFSSSEGQVIDISSLNSITTLKEGVALTNSGTFDQLYILASNTVSITGETGADCYLKAGDYSYNDGDYPAATTNSSLAGVANVTETGFGNKDADMGDLNSYKTTPAVTTEVNGTQTTSLDLYLVNKDTKIPGLGGTINAYLFVGNMANTINLNSSKEGTIWVDFDTSESSELNTACTNANWVNTKFGLSIEQ